MAHPSVMIAGLIVGSDPEIRFTPKGGKTARVSLLTKSRRKKRGSDEYIAAAFHISPKNKGATSFDAAPFCRELLFETSGEGKPDRRR